MTSVTIQLTAETEQRLRLQASRCGEVLESYLRHLAEKAASEDTQSTDMLGQGIEWLTGRGDEEVRAARERILATTPPPRDVPAGKTVLDVLEGQWPGIETDAEPGSPGQDLVVAELPLYLLDTNIPVHLIRGDGVAPASR